MIALILIVVAVSHPGQSPSSHCTEERNAARILRASSVAEVEQLRASLPSTYAMRFSYAYRHFELNPRSLGAARVYLRTLPKNTAEQSAHYLIDGHDCEMGDLDDRALDQVYDGTERLAAQAIMLTPDSMDSYIRFALPATEDVHSEYGRLSVVVCHKYPQAFRVSVAHLPNTDRQWFMTHIFDPKHCRSLQPEEE